MGEVMFKKQSNPVTLHSSETSLCTSRTPEGVRSPDDLIRNAQPATKKEERLLLDFSQLTNDHPEVIPRLAELVYSRLEDNRAASVHECFEHVRWEMHVHMPNGLAPLLSRAVLYTHPDLTGMVRVVPVPLDEALGLRVSDKKLPGEYARRLEWCNGQPLTETPTPTLKKTVESVRPAQGELFEVA
jgi:hypothetical protein